MPGVLIDNLLYNIGKPIDARYYTIAGSPWGSPNAFLTAYPESDGVRYLGLTAAIADGSTSIKEYWFKDGLANANFVQKGTGSSGVENGLSINSSKIILGSYTNTTYTLKENQSSYIYGKGSAIDFKIDDTNITTPTTSSRIYLDKSSSYIESSSLPNTPGATGVTSKVISLNAKSSMSTNNYTSSAYNAQAKFLILYPWTNNPTYNPTTQTPAPPLLDSNHSFQIYDNYVNTNKDSAILAHYYDERVGNTYWQETYTSNFGNLTVGKVYTLKTKNAGDNFPSTLGTTIIGSANTNGWVFVYNGNTSGATWTNGSIINGDFPRIDRAAKSAIISAEEDINGKSIIKLDAKNTIIGQSVDAGNATYSLISGYSNSITSNGNYNVILGGGNIINHGTDSSVNANASYVIGESNIITKFHSGAIGTNNENLGNYCHSIGYDLKVPATNTGTFQVGIFNDVFSIDYGSSLGSPLGTYPSFSVGGGNQAALSPSAPKNLFHIMKDGLAKSYNGIDSRTGTRGITFPQWVSTGWEGQNPTGRAFGSPGKYIISSYGYIVGEGASGTGTTITITSLSDATALASLGVITGALISIASGTGAFSTSTVRVSSYNSGTKTITITGGTITTPLSNARIRIGDNFTNVIDTIIWGRTGLDGCVFYGNSTTTATLWSYGSTVIKVQRPSSPQLGEMGYNLIINQLEYYNGTGWIAI